MQLAIPPHEQQSERARWVTERVYAEVYGLSRQTLTNWRYRDRLAGRSTAAPGQPVYRTFGRAVRYLIEASDDAIAEAAAKLKKIDAARGKSLDAENNGAAA
jgi:hypothetical protein